MTTAHRYTEQADEPAKAEPVSRCDHICLRDDGHVARGEPHFYGYEHPSPRKHADGREVAEVVAALRYAADLEREVVKAQMEYADALITIAELRARLAVAEQLADDFPVGDLLTTRAHGLNQWMRRLIFFRSARPVTDQTGAET